MVGQHKGGRGGRHQPTLFPEADLILRQHGVRRDPKAKPCQDRVDHPVSCAGYALSLARERMCTIKAKCFRYFNDTKLYIP